MRSEFFPALYECTQEMMAAYTADHSFMYIIAHERTQLAVCRKACGCHMDEMIAEYAACDAARRRRVTMAAAQPQGPLSGQCGCEPVART
jgi:hypothetical protein